MWRSSPVRSLRRRPPLPSMHFAVDQRRLAQSWRRDRPKPPSSAPVHDRVHAIDPEAEDLLALPALVANGIRTIDFVWEDGANLYVLMPETPREPAIAAIARVTSRLVVLRSREVRVAMFPDDASTAGALLDVLRGDGQTSVPVGSPAGHSAGPDVVTADLIASASLTTLPR